MPKKYPQITLAVPKDIDYKKLFKSLEGLSNIQRKNFKDSIYLFLSFLVPTESYLRKYSKNDYFKPINSEKFNKIARNRFKEIKEKLLNHTYSIIEENPSYQNERKSKSYKLNEMYFTTEIKFITIQSKISENYQNFLNSQTKEKEVLNSKYQYLIEQYDRRITISPEADSYINRLECEFSENTHEQIVKEKSILSFKDKKQMEIYFMRNNVKKIKNGEFDPSVSESNHRLNSVLTQIKKELRPYLLINNNPVAEVDISGSHLYVLASILNEDFFTSITNEFSLYQIYNELYLDLINLNSKYSIPSNSNTYIINKKNTPPIPFMCGTFKSEIIKFKELYDGNDIYENINKLIFNGEKTRDQIKDGIMNFLNQSDFRKKSGFISKMKKHFPNINGLIEKIQRVNQHKSCFALLLQRVESYLLIQIGAKELLNQIPDLCFFTIHDAVAVEKSKAREVKAILERKISEKTRVKIQFKVKH